jgi:hypothetical protein
MAVCYEQNAIQATGLHYNCAFVLVLATEEVSAALRPSLYDGANCSEGY